MATSTSFQENAQSLGMPAAPLIPTSAQMQQMMAAMAGKNNPAGGLDSASLMMQYYQTVAEKCWGLNSPPGSDSSSSGSTSVSNNAIKNSPVTSQQGRTKFRNTFTAQHIPRFRIYSIITAVIIVYLCQRQVKL